VPSPCRTFRAVIRGFLVAGVQPFIARTLCFVTMKIRAAVRADAPLMRQVEIASGERFREVGLDAIADDEPPPAAVFEAYAAASRAWVAVAPSSGVVGFVIVDMVDGAAHIEQVSVFRPHQGKGVGRALIDQVGRWAAENGMPALSLTTFNDVPWNRPLYEHLGFRVLSAKEIGPGLRAVMATEASHGLDPARRVAMRKDCRLEGDGAPPSPVLT